MANRSSTAVRESRMAIGPTTRQRTEARREPRASPRRWRPVVAGLVALGLLLVPVPWRLQVGDDPLALAWDLDGRLQVDGELLDPPGRWTWLTVGRPPLAVEVLVDLLDGGERSSWDIRDGAATSRPAVVEAVAAAAGLQAAGRDVQVGLTVTLSDPIDPRLPERAVLVELNGITLGDRGDWAVAASRPGLPVTFRLSDGTTGTHAGRTLPWRDIEVADVPPVDLEARLFGNLPDVTPIQWARDHLALGPSHGLMVALTTWAAASGVGLDGVHVAGTGGIRGDGLITPIGGLEHKARAARDDGADLLFFPLPQAGELDGFDPGAMTLVGISRLEDATRVLESWGGGTRRTGPA